jgi:hypothetical protein
MGQEFKPGHFRHVEIRDDYVRDYHLFELEKSVKSFSLTRIWRSRIGIPGKILSDSIALLPTSSSARSVVRLRSDVGVSMIQLRPKLPWQHLANTTKISSPVLRYRNNGLNRLFLRTS